MSRDYNCIISCVHQKKHKSRLHTIVQFDLTQTFHWDLSKNNVVLNLLSYNQ